MTAAKVKPAGSGGVDEGEALLAALDGSYSEARQGRMWRGGFGPERILPGYQGSEQLPDLCRSVAFVLGQPCARKPGGKGSAPGPWIVQRWRDQMGPAGLFGHEGIATHYGSFNVSGGAAVVEKASAWRLGEMVDVGVDYLRQALLTWALFASPGAPTIDRADRCTDALCIGPVGYRCQTHGGGVMAGILAAELGLPYDVDKVTRQPYYWPVLVYARYGCCGQVFSAAERAALVALIVDGNIGAVLGSSLAPVLAAVRARTRFTTWRWERGTASAMLRSEDDPWNSNGSPSYAAVTCWAPGHETHRHLEIDVGEAMRKPRPGTCRVELGPDEWTAVARHDSAAVESSARLALPTAPLGRLLWTATVGPDGGWQINTKGAAVGVDVGPIPQPTDPKGPW